MYFLKETFFLTLNFYLLRPKKAKDFIPSVAEQLHFSEDVVKDVVDYYWRNIRKSLSSLDHSRIHLTNLGDFTIKHWKIDEKIEGLEKWEETNKQKGLQQITARFKTAETLYDLKKLKGLVEEENQRKEFIKLHKKSYESKG
jgi:hypothetical protein